MTVLTGISKTDRQLLRSTFAALTGGSGGGLDALVQIAGKTQALDVRFADTEGLRGVRAPILDVPTTPHAPSGTRPESEVPPTAGPPRSQAGQEMADLAARESELATDLELTRRELDRERELLSSTDPGTSDDSDELHPADVAVMCDRLRELLALEDRPDLTGLVERLDSANSHRIYDLHREDALGRLAAECRAAIASARGYLATFEESPSPAAQTPGEAQHDDPSERAPIPAPEAPDLESHTIARIDLLEELAGFWQQRRTEMELRQADVERLVQEANEVLLAAGRHPVRSVHTAMLEVRSLAADGEPGAKAELLEALAAWLGIGDREGAAAEIDAEELLATADDRLTNGRPRDVGMSESGPWHPGTSERVSGLEATEHRLALQLDSLRGDLAARRRGSELFPGTDIRANPFSGAAATRATEPTPGEPSWSLASALTALRCGPVRTTLPVLVVEPPDRDHALVAVDPLSVAAMAISGQVVWVTDRLSVVSSLEVLGDEVDIIRA